MKNIDRDKVLIILIWCENRFGKSKFRKTFPNLRVYKSNGNYVNGYKEDSCCGSFISETNTINVFLGSVKSVKHLCEIIIHEYRHYKLNDAEYDKHTKKLKKLGLSSEQIYKIHPHEKSANRSEKQWGDICYQELKSRLYRKTKR